MPISASRVSLKSKRGYVMSGKRAVPAFHAAMKSISTDAGQLTEASNRMPRVAATMRRSSSE